MEFCPKCKTLMLPTKKTAICPKCKSRVKADKVDILIKEKIAHSEKEKVAKRAKEVEETYPTVKTECPKCRNKTAYWWVQQMSGYEDEPETEFFRCTKCRNTWRKSAG
jgi:DNA-directed RNA polymerase subunit M